MKHLTQQTTLRMKEILAELKKGQSVYPRCLLLNEIGAACQNGDDTTAGDGEQYLRLLLSSRSISDRTIAYCALYCLNDDGENEALLENFRNESRNARFMPAIKRMLES